MFVPLPSQAKWVKVQLHDFLFEELTSSEERAFRMTFLSLWKSPGCEIIAHVCLLISALDTCAITSLIHVGPREGELGLSMGTYSDSKRSNHSRADRREAFFG